MRDDYLRRPLVVRPFKSAEKAIADMHLLEAAISGGSALQYFRDRGEWSEVSTRALERGRARGIIDCDDLCVAMLTLKGEELLIELIGNGARTRTAGRPRYLSPQAHPMAGKGQEQWRGQEA